MSVPAFSGHQPCQFQPQPCQPGPSPCSFRALLPFEPSPSATVRVALQPASFLSQSAQLLPAAASSPFQSAVWLPAATGALGAPAAAGSAAAGAAGVAAPPAGGGDKHAVLAPRLQAAAIARSRTLTPFIGNRDVALIVCSFA